MVATLEQAVASSIASQMASVKQGTELDKMLVCASIILFEDALLLSSSEFH